LTIVALTIGQIEQIKQHLHVNFEMTDFGEVSWLLRLDVQQDRQSCTISIGQAAFVDIILARFNLTDVKPVSTPMEPGAILVPAQCPSTPEEIIDIEGVPYCKGMGSLMYCIISTKFSQGVTCYHKCSLESVFISRQ
jgi:hypothetical protein